MDNCICRAQKLAIIANTVAVAITEKLSVSEQNVIGNLIVQIGSTILSIAAAAELCESTKSGDSNNQNEPSDKTA